MSSNQDSVAKSFLMLAAFLAVSATLGLVVHKFNESHSKHKKTGSKLSVRKSFLAPSEVKPNTPLKAAPNKKLLDDEMMKGKLLEG